VDLGKPLVIFVVKNEDSPKVLLPAFWEVKGHMHPAGEFVPGEVRDFVAVRTNIEDDNPYEVVYHEYTHAIMNLNFQGLPLWLNEGIAEFFGNSTIHDKEVEYGKIPLWQLRVIRENRLIPIDTLWLADANSPYYNEDNRASIFYAESWALVHYLLMDPAAQKQQLLLNFLAAWDATGDQVGAAKKAFGDLKKFSNAMDAYARQPMFYIGKVHTAIHGDPKSYKSRILSPAEVAANQGLFFLQTQRLKEAASSTDAALAADPNLALAHEARGILEFHERDFPAAEQEFARSLELNPSSYVANFYEAQSRMRAGMSDYAQLAEITGYLERSVSLNPQFAPAYALLSNFYSLRPETRDQALAMGKKATELEPGNLSYAISYGFVLVSMGDFANAKLLAARVQAAARTTFERQSAANFASLVAAREQIPMSSGYPGQLAVRSNPPERTREIAVPDPENPIPKPPPQKVDRVPEPATSQSAVAQPSVTQPPPAPRHFVLGPEYHLEGKIIAADCPNSGELKLTVSINTVAMKFHAADRKTIQLTSANKPATAEQPACPIWKGRRAKITFDSNPPGEFDGEVTAIYFF
jgi:tetratricopeptide (TPR) repeat protein